MFWIFVFLNDGPVEVIKTKIQNMRRGDRQAPQSAGSADTNAPKSETPVEEQPKPQDQNAAANSNAPSSTSVNSPSAAPDANAGTNAGNSPQNVTAATGNQTPAGQKTAPLAQSSSVNGAQPAAGQNASQRKATLLASTSNAAPAPLPDVAQPAAQKPKSKPQAAPEDDEEVAVKKVIPGGEDLDKANNASDSAAAAAAESLALFALSRSMPATRLPLRHGCGRQPPRAIPTRRYGWPTCTSKATACRTIANRRWFC